MCWSVKNLRVMVMRKSSPNWPSPPQNAKFKDLTPISQAKRMCLKISTRRCPTICFPNSRQIDADLDRICIGASNILSILIT